MSDYRETLIAEADEFQAVLNDSSGFVDIIDGEGVIRLSMPIDTWEKFVSPQDGDY